MDHAVRRADVRFDDVGRDAHAVDGKRLVVRLVVKPQLIKGMIKRLNFRVFILVQKNDKSLNFRGIGKDIGKPQLFQRTFEF